MHRFDPPSTKYLVDVVWKEGKRGEAHAMVKTISGQFVEIPDPRTANDIAREYREFEKAQAAYEAFTRKLRDERLH